MMGMFGGGPGQPTTYSDVCINCQQVIVVEIDDRDVNGAMKWAFDRENSPLIQDAMPNTSVATREFIMSGCCDECFNKLFPPEEPEEGDRITWTASQRNESDFYRVNDNPNLRSGLGDRTGEHGDS